MTHTKHLTFWDQLTSVAAGDQLTSTERTLFASCALSRLKGQPLPELPADLLRRELILTVLDWRPVNDDD